MNFKYTIVSSDFGGPCLAVKYDGARKELTIGGNKKFIDTMEFFMMNHFSIPADNWKMKETQKNKIRLQTKPVKLEIFRDGIRKIMEVPGFVASITKAHERIMR